MQPQHLLWAVLALLMCGQVAPSECDESLDDLRNKKVEVAVEWVKSTGISYGGDIITPAEVMTASRAWMDARLDAAKTKAESIDARQTYYDSMTQLHAKIQQLFDSDAAGGKARQMLEAKYRMLEAQVWLMEEKAKP